MTIDELIERLREFRANHSGTATVTVTMPGDPVDAPLHGLTDAGWYPLRRDSAGRLHPDDQPDHANVDGAVLILD